MYMYSSPVGSQRFGQLVGSGMGPSPIPPQQLSFSSPTSRPDRVNELTEDIKSIKDCMGMIDNTLNTINSKINSLEEKLSSIDTRVNEVEKSCSFVRKKYESQKTDIQNAKDSSTRSM